MSRLRRLRQRRRKQFIKTTMSSLALILVIGTVQSTTTYAWFTDKELIDNDLSITMGKLDVKIEEGLNVDNLQVDQISEKKFKIENIGSLDQKIKLKFSKSKSHTLEPENLKYIDYKLDIKTSKGDKVSINKLNNSEVELLNSDGSRLILEDGDYLDCKSTINIKNGITLEEKKLLYEKIINFDITVLASQVNYIGGVVDNNEIGFTDKDGQDNLVKIGKIYSCEELTPNLDVEFDDGRKEIEINIPKEYENNKKLDLVSVDRLEGTGEFSGIEVEKKNGKPDVDKDDFDIVKISGAKFDKDKIGECFSDEQKLRVLLIFEGKHGGKIITVKEVWEIKFRVNKAGNLEAYYVVFNREKSIDTIVESEVVEPPKEEVEVPSEPEVVEPPKEEVEVPSEPEVVEPSKEEVEVPSEPEVVEPLNEEVATHIQTDIIAQKKEEIDIEE